jgi:hypothetical protein
MVYSFKSDYQFKVLKIAYVVISNALNTFYVT